MISSTVRRISSGVINGAGEYAPMPPVFGPVSPSNARLWSCAVSSITNLSPSEMAKTLEQEFGERPIWRGIETSGAALELWANAAASSWSAVRIDPNGRACLVDAGDAWQSLEPKPKERSA